MSKHRYGVFSILVALAFSTNLYAQEGARLDEKILSANRELDRQLLEAHTLKDAAMLVGLFSDSPSVFFISPGGTLNKGRDAILHTFQNFFDHLDSIRGEIKEITYLPAGEGVIAVGTVIYSRKPKDAPADQKTVIWTDYRHVENGKWVYVFRHAHWPLETIKPATGRD